MLVIQGWVWIQHSAWPEIFVNTTVWISIKYNRVKTPGLYWDHVFREADNSRGVCLRRHLLDAIFLNFQNVWGSSRLDPLLLYLALNPLIALWLLTSLFRCACPMQVETSTRYEWGILPRIFFLIIKSCQISIVFKLIFGLNKTLLVVSVSQERFSFVEIFECGPIHLGLLGLLVLSDWVELGSSEATLFKMIVLKLVFRRLFLYFWRFF